AGETLLAAAARARRSAGRREPADCDHAVNETHRTVAYGLARPTAVTARAYCYCEIRRGGLIRGGLIDDALIHGRLIRGVVGGGALVARPIRRAGRGRHVQRDRVVP